MPRMQDAAPSVDGMVNKSRVTRQADSVVIRADTSNFDYARCYYQRFGKN